MAKIIVVANNKGGVGKTTTVFNLASALQILGKKVLMVDLDPQASLTTTYAGIEPLTLKYTTHDVFTNDVLKAKDCIVSKDNIDIMPAGIDLSAAEIQIVNKIGREYILKNKIKEIEDQYDYIIIDTSPYLGILTINAMTAAQYIIAPIEPTYMALKGLDILDGVVKQVQSINKEMKFMGVLITMYDRRITHHKEVIEITKKRYPVFKTMIKRSIKFSDASVAAESIFTFAGENFDGAKEYMAFAREVLRDGQED